MGYRKPFVVLVQDPTNVGGFVDRQEPAAMQYYLGQEAGFEVLPYKYSYDLVEDVDLLKYYTQHKLLVLVIIAEEQYGDDHDRCIKFIREQVSESVHIHILSGRFGPSEKSEITDPYMTKFYPDAREFVDLLANLKKNWVAPKDWLGAETPGDQRILMKQLEHSYRHHYLRENDDLICGTPDVNTQIVTQALRLKLLPVELLKAEFDDTLVYRTKKLPPVGTKIYREERARIQAMSDQERYDLETEILRMSGKERHPSGGVLVTRVALGEGIIGYGIDKVTFENIEISRHGLHHYAPDLVAQRISAIEAIRNSEFGVFYERYLHRVISGLVYLHVEGFNTPILVLYVSELNGHDPEEVKRVARFILNEQKYIPVDPSMKPLEG